MVSEHPEDDVDPSALNQALLAGDNTGRNLQHLPEDGTEKDREEGQGGGNGQQQGGKEAGALADVAQSLVGILYQLNDPADKRLSLTPTIVSANTTNQDGPRRVDPGTRAAHIDM